MGADVVYDEDAAVPLSREVFAPAAAGLHPMLAAGLGAAMSAWVQTERAVTAARGVRGVVVRPGLVYGRGGSFDLPSIIALARQHGHGVHLGSGATRQGYVHIDDLAELYCLAVERAQAGAILHGITSEGQSTGPRRGGRAHDRRGRRHRKPHSAPDARSGRNEGYGGNLTSMAAPPGGAGATAARPA
jgi:nucleoside-diphosphate-sugar epimerase